MIYALVVAVEDFRRDLYLGVLGYHLRRNLDAVHDLDAALDDGVVLHVAHADEVVDLRDAEPVQDVGHQGLKTRILNTSNTLSAVEIPARWVASMASKG